MLNSKIIIIKLKINLDFRNTVYVRQYFSKITKTLISCW